jgi:hypothetical protein
MDRCVTTLAALLAAPLLLAGSARDRHVNVLAAYEAAKTSEATAAVAVWLEPQTPDIRVNEQPAPRLTLSDDQRVLIDRQGPPPDKVTPYDPRTAHYLDPEQPVRFPVALAKGAPRGPQLVPAQVTFFYCSTSAGWCRKGTADVEVVVKVE